MAVVTIFDKTLLWRYACYPQYFLQALLLFYGFSYSVFRRSNHFIFRCPKYKYNRFRTSTLRKNIAYGDYPMIHGLKTSHIRTNIMTQIFMSAVFIWCTLYPTQLDGMSDKATQNSKVDQIFILDTNTNLIILPLKLKDAYWQRAREHYTNLTSAYQGDCAALQALFQTYTLPEEASSGNISWVNKNLLQAATFYAVCHSTCYSMCERNTERPDFKSFMKRVPALKLRKLNPEDIMSSKNWFNKALMNRIADKNKDIDSNKDVSYIENEKIISDCFAKCATLDEVYQEYMAYLEHISQQDDNSNNDSKNEPDDQMKSATYFEYCRFSGTYKKLIPCLVVGATAVSLICYQAFKHRNYLYNKLWGNASTENTTESL